MVPWFWWLVGGAAAALIGGAAWGVLRRRRESEEEEAIAIPYVPPSPAIPVAEREAVTPDVPAPMRPVSPGASATPSQPAPPQKPSGAAQSGFVTSTTAPSADPFVVQMELLRIAFVDQDVQLSVELGVGNTSHSGIDRMRVVSEVISASPRQDGLIKAFAARAKLAATAPPFDLAAGTGVKLPFDLLLPRSAVHVVDMGGRPIFVPIVLVDLSWSTGLSIRRFNSAFMLGQMGQGGRIAPFRLDAPAPAGPFLSSRYQPK